MNPGGLGIIGIGIFILVIGYITKDRTFMMIAAFIILAGFGILFAKNTSKNPATNSLYYRCPNCGHSAGEEIPKERREDEKIYKCKLCGYKW